MATAGNHPWRVQAAAWYSSGGSRHTEALQCIAWTLCREELACKFQCGVFFCAIVNFPCAVRLQIFGLYWNDEEFVQKAVQAKHPLDVELAVPLELRKTIEFNWRIVLSFCQIGWGEPKHWLPMSERALKHSMDPSGVSVAISGKRILLFEEMLREMIVPDLEVADDELRHGASLTGQVPITNMLPGKFATALSTVDELRNHARRVWPVHVLVHVRFMSQTRNCGSSLLHSQFNQQFSGGNFTLPPSPVLFLSSLLKLYLSTLFVPFCFPT